MSTAPPPASAPAGRSPRLSRAGGFWLLATTQFTLMAASSAPSPLYSEYARDWGLSATAVTIVFAVYAVAVLAALLVAGALSDHLGRRPVLIAALVGEAAAMVVMMTADGVGQLIVGRALQGLATGAAAGAISAGLIDLQHPGSRLGALLNSVGTTGGMAVGALAGGALTQYAPSPHVVVFALLAAASLALAAAVPLVPETSPLRPGALASLRPRVSVPHADRRAFLIAAPSFTASWAIGGLYLSLGSSLTADILHTGNHVVAGLVVALLPGTAGLACYALRDMAPLPMMLSGSVALAAGTLLTLPALLLPSMPLLLAATVVAGFGFGTSFFGGFRMLAHTAAPEQRALLFASVYVMCYLANSVPAVAAGLAIPGLGLRETATGYIGAVGALALLSIPFGIGTLRRAGAKAPAAAPHAPAGAR
ncbi:MFS transporter [Streptomyces sp. NBC_00102]|uniref:MFS transporter n=1 Tax=Streptomyces sp. NBC_00102 TaxID=2975652 RepID=UPI00225A465D|nr:MFS transporter [Streptomyces sp. NBC_00102]MCX5396086.1 MFS transporter [Streptomyces sp. NBC_00102]